MSSLKRLRHRGEWLVVRTLALIVPLLPRRFWLGMGTVFGAIASWVHRPGRAVALENIEAAFGQIYSPAQRRLLVRQSYQHFARAMADLYWSRRLTRENLSEFVDLSEVERLRRELTPGESVIFACLHYGGFEWIALVLGLCGFQCTVVTQRFKNPLLNTTFNELRGISGHQTIRREGAMLRMFRALQKGRSVILAVDLTVSAKMPSVPIECFGLLTCVTFAHAWLHRRTDARIIPTHCEPSPGGRYRLVLHPALEIPPGATEQEIAQACWDRFEPVVRQNPAPWLWMYKHWRYQPKIASRSYPSYANVSHHFGRLLDRIAAEKAEKAA